MYKKIFENLNVNGYHIGDFNEFFNELTGVKEEDFFEWSEYLKSTAIEKDKHYCYRHNFIAQNNPENYLKLSNYNGPIPTDEEKLQEIPNIRAQNRKDFIKFVDEHDKRRGTNFLKTFPEMEEFYYKIKENI